MKIIHTADWHLGKSIFGQSLLADQSHFLWQTFLPLLERERPDLVLVAGDVFDRSVAPVEALRLFDELTLVVCRTLHIPMAVIAGNHDGAERLAMGAGLLQASGLYIAGTLADCLEPVRLSDEYGPLNLYLLPYFEPLQAREWLEDETIRGFEAAYSAVLGKIKAHMPQAERNILMAHCFVAGGLTSESEAPLYIGGSAQVPAVLFEGFDYVALGHLHAPQRAGADTVRYAGSPLKYSFDEERQKKGLTLLNIKEKGNIAIEVCPVAPRRDMRTVRGSMEALLASGQQDPRGDDYVFAVLEDTVPIYEPMARLRKVYPHVLGLQNLWLQGALKAEERRGELTRQLKSRQSSDQMLFEAFLEQVCQVTPSEEDLALYREACRRAGREAAE